jgi:hypothetical protein
MKILKYIFESPYLIILIAIILMVISPNEINLFVALIMFLTYISSIIYIITQRKWRKLIISLIGPFFIVAIIFYFFYEFANGLKPRSELGDSKFYTEEILRTSNLKIPKEFKFVSKIDTIVYIGMGGDFDSECLYTGSKISIKKLESQILSQKEFKKTEPILDPSEILTEKNFKKNNLKSVYMKDVENSYTVYIAFDKYHSKIYFKSIHY